MATKIIEHKYTPREIFIPFHHRTQRWAIKVVHRRGGKTVATVNDTISRITYFEPPLIHNTKISIVDGVEHLPSYSQDPGRFAYVAPYLNQARQIAWDYLKRYSMGMTKKISEAELSITYFNDCRFTLYGADNPDAFRGQYFDGVDLDEYGMMRPSVWSEVLLPTLVDRQGWAVFIGTPNGPNHFRDLVTRAKQDPERWFYECHPVSVTQLIPMEELEEMKRLMLPEEYAQEMECSFEASARGAFYAAEMMAAEQEGRVKSISTNVDLPLHFVFDLGWRDDTAMIAFQQAVDGYPILHSESDHLRATGHYINRINQICEEHKVTRGEIWLPHDAWAKTMQTGRSIMEQFLEAGIRPRRVPSLSELDGIAAGRLLFPMVYFNEPHTLQLREALKTFRRAWDEDKKAFSNRPIDDWSVHFADTFRYFALVTQLQTPSRASAPIRTRTVAQAKTTYPFNMNDLWEMNNGRTSGRIA